MASDSKYTCPLLTGPSQAAMSASAMPQKDAAPRGVGFWVVSASLVSFLRKLSIPKLCCCYIYADPP